ncbi:C-terminal binding protein [Acinetobacter halotolerans]|uniref:C-terminal binding protein n=1 Tax=Acinetobacter halotolerans TaxID=1752076 RepID=A0A4Q6XIF1_9GAMM|nr:C-terminal binding protein [Acinetobacter halotolerans]RZF55663.1 C-terminal binding protein [Acinetobacter halotolerans]
MKIAITDRIQNLGAHQKKFDDLGYEFYFLNSLNENEYSEEILKQVDAMLVWHAKITEKTINHLNNCKIVIRYGIGYDQVDGESLRHKKIPFANNPSYCVEEVADTTIGMLLALTRNISRYNNLARKYKDSWQENHLNSWRSSQRTVGLIGLGKIGTATALRLRALNFNVIVYDPYITTSYFKSLNLKRVHTLQELLSTSDIVSLHCPLTNETHGLINENFLKLMKQDAVLINTARGKMLKNFDVLYDHLINNPDFKVALDVLPEEPPKEHPLIESWCNGAEWLAERLIINPHNAYFSDAASIDQMGDAYFELVEALSKNKFNNIVN